jgi:hypothetical protein
VTGYLVAEEMLEAAQVGGKALAKPVAEFAWDRGVIGTRSPGRQESGHSGALIGSPSRMELDLASRHPLEIVQARDGLVDRAVVLMPLVEVNRGRIGGEVVKYRAQRLTWPVAEHLARDHEYLAAVEVVEKRRELEPVQAGPEVTVVEQGHFHAAPLPAC